MARYTTLTSFLAMLFVALALVAVGTSALEIQNAEAKSGVVAEVGPFTAVPTREKVMACAQNWVDRKVPYCQCINSICCGNCPYCGTYRCDCSGYVAYCLGMTAGLNTNSLPTQAKLITKNELKKGDFINCASRHVVFFGGWTDNSKTRYVVYQEPGCGAIKHAYKSVTTYPNGNDACYKPYRRNGMTSSLADAAAASSDFDDTFASPEDIKEAFLNTPFFANLTEAESEIEMAKVRDHGRKLGYFTFA